MPWSKREMGEHVGVPGRGRRDVHWSCRSRMSRRNLLYSIEMNLGVYWRGVGRSGVGRGEHGGLSKKTLGDGVGVGEMGRVLRGII